MLFLLSPAKALDYETPVDSGVAYTQPRFVKQAGQLIDVLREQSPQQLARLMNISDKLSTLNVARYEAWRTKPAASDTRQAVLAFNGDAYRGLDAASLDVADMDWMQQHLLILSGLYGVLRPLDLIQPHRLEMGTRLGTSHGDNLYQFWGPQIADEINRRQADVSQPVVVNLASQEYFKSVDVQRLNARVIDCVFEDEKNGQYKVISFHAKRARGLMVRYATKGRVQQPEELQRFDLQGYAFAAGASEANRWVFRRPQGAIQ